MAKTTTHVYCGPTEDTFKIEVRGISGNIVNSVIVGYEEMRSIVFHMPLIYVSGYVTDYYPEISELV